MSAAADTERREMQEWVSLFANRNEMAEEYATLLITAPANSEGWPLLNEAIIRRWSPSGLEYIKRQAWKIAQAHA